VFIKLGEEKETPVADMHALLLCLRACPAVLFVKGRLAAALQAAACCCSAGQADLASMDLLCYLQTCPPELCFQGRLLRLRGYACSLLRQCVCSSTLLMDRGHVLQTFRVAGNKPTGLMHGAWCVWWLENSVHAAQLALAFELCTARAYLCV
jgi:hypothetical protein